VTTNGANAVTAYGWGNHASAGYLTSESDPVFTAHLAYDITAADTTRWGTTGGGGTPGGSNGDIQYNNSGSFGGFGDWSGGTLTVDGALNATSLNVNTGAIYFTGYDSQWSINATSSTSLNFYNDAQSADVFTISESGNGTFAGNLYCAEGYRGGSSRNLKTNIRSMRRSGLTIINNLDIVTFNYKKDGMFGVGFIAEDTDKWLSGENQKEHIYQNHLGVISKAIQEEDQKVEKLRELISELTIKLYEAEKRIKKLERKCKR
jgi:hypothetical protein